MPHFGIVYGDIGTSALYGFKQAADAAGAISPETVTGIVSASLWSLIVIVSFKYAILIMRADKRGEGGIVALLALLDVRHAPAGSWRAPARTCHRSDPHHDPGWPVPGPAQGDRVHRITSGTIAFCTSVCSSRPSVAMCRASIRTSAQSSSRSVPA